MKKFLAALLAVLMVLAIACTAVSAEETEQTLISSQDLSAASDHYLTTPAAAYEEGGFGVISFYAEASMNVGTDSLLASAPVYTFTTAKAGMTVYINYYVAENNGNMTLFFRQNNSTFDRVDSSVGYHKLAFHVTETTLSSIVLYFKNETSAAGSIKVYFGEATVRNGLNDIGSLSEKTVKAADNAAYQETNSFPVAYGADGNYPNTAVLVSDVPALVGNAAFDDPDSTTDKVIAMHGASGTFLAGNYFGTFKKGCTYVITIDMYATEAIPAANARMLPIANGPTTTDFMADITIPAGFSQLVVTYAPTAETWNFGIHRPSGGSDAVVYLGDIKIEEFAYDSTTSEYTFDADTLKYAGISTAFEKTVVPGSDTSALKITVDQITAATTGGLLRVFNDGIASTIACNPLPETRKVYLTYYVDGDGSTLFFHNASGFSAVDASRGYHTVEIPAAVFGADGYINFHNNAVKNDLYVISLKVENTFTYTGEVYSPETAYGAKISAKGATVDFMTGIETLTDEAVYQVSMTYRVFSVYGEEKGLVTMGNDKTKLEAKTGYYTSGITVFDGAAKVSVTAPEATMIVLDKITYKVAGPELSELMQTMNNLQKDIVLDANIATTVELAIADLTTVIKDTLGKDYDVISVELADAEGAFAKAEKETAALTLKASAADGKLVATVEIKNLLTEYTYKTDLTFTIGTNAGVTASLPTGDAFTVVALVSLVALIALAGVVIAKKKIHG